MKGFVLLILGVYLVAGALFAIDHAVNLHECHAAAAAAANDDDDEDDDANEDASNLAAIRIVVQQPPASTVRHAAAKHTRARVHTYTHTHTHTHTCPSSHAAHADRQTPEIVRKST